ncbi:MAG: PQQ-dependent sugar dehydrogenase [Chloroflexi bacterium]|nr:PQQ-dependent sugar dehydrogenase [Chloroflexota bacterium]
MPPITRHAAAALLIALLVGPAAPAASAASAAVVPARIHLDLSRIATGLSKPLLVADAGDGSGRLFVVEQTGAIRIIKAGKVLPAPFLDLGASVSGGNEQGLLGLAFHPAYRSNGKLYVSYTDRAGTSIIREYRVSSSNPDRVDGASGRTLLRLRQPYANHNGGNIVFGPDGYLYIGFGDGGSAGDPGNRAQDLGTLLGKLLRIDVDRRTGTLPYGIPGSNPFVGRAGLDQIWAYGLRNPWRWSFDRATGDLWIGDVGQDTWEEVDRAPATHGRNAGRGLNFGWRTMEASHCYAPPSGCSRTGKTPPLTEYRHANGRCSITGGFVYRGAKYPDLVGAYLFADYCSGEIWYVDRGAARGSAPRLALDTDALITSFGQDRAGELYLTDGSGSVYRLTDA